MSTNILASSGKGKYLNFQTCDLHRFLIFTLYVFSDTISKPSDRYPAVGSNTIFTTLERGRTIGKILDAMRRPSSKRFNNPDIFNGLSDKQIRAKWLEFVLFCFEACGVHFVVDSGSPEAKNRQRSIARYNKYLEATADEMHNVVFRGCLSIMYDAFGTPVAHRLPTRAGIACHLSFMETSMKMLLCANRDLLYRSKYSFKR
jgi:hypothetical protein